VRYQAVLFDAGETLVHPSPSFAELFADVLTGRGHPCEPADVLEASAVVFDRFDEAARDREGWTTSLERSARFWKGVYRRMLGALGLPELDGLPDVLYETFTDLRNYALFEDVVPMLDDLAPTGIDLGIVSNFEPWLEDLLGHLGVRDRFPVRAISGVEGVEKPDPALFERAIDRLGHPVVSVAYVGDNPAFDVGPAAAVGMTPILIDRRGRFPDHEGRRIDDLRALRATLEEA
jgi:putative hydrolase of the HAD superfamily